MSYTDMIINVWHSGSTEVCISTGLHAMLSQMCVSSSRISSKYQARGSLWWYTPRTHAGIVLFLFYVSMQDLFDYLNLDYWDVRFDIDFFMAQTGDRYTKQVHRHKTVFNKQMYIWFPPHDCTLLIVCFARLRGAPRRLLGRLRRRRAACLAPRRRSL